MNLDGYLLSIIGVILLCSIITAIIPNGKTAGVIKGITRLVCLLTIISPIPYFLKGEKIFDNTNEENTKIANGFFPQTGIQTDEEFIHYYSEMKIRETEALLEKEMKDLFGQSTKINIFWVYDSKEGCVDTDKIRVTKIFVQTENPLSEEEKREMSNYLTKNYCSEVQIE